MCLVRAPSTCLLTLQSFTIHSWTPGQRGEMGGCPEGQSHSRYVSTLHFLWWLFLRLWGFWGEGLTYHSVRAFFFFFLDWYQLVQTNSTFFRLGSVHSGSVSWDHWPSVSWWVACKLVFHDEIGSHTMPGQQSQPTPTSWGQGCLCVTCHLYLWQNDQGLLRATEVTPGGTDTR